VLAAPLLLASMLATLPAQAQTPAQSLAPSQAVTKAPMAVNAARPDPLDAQASVPASSYRSPLAQYRRLGDEQAISWREANDTVTRIGGWRAYAREAQQPDAAPAARPVDAAPAAKPSDPAKPMPAGHGGHKMP
jgi:hypothetical protein